MTKALGASELNAMGRARLVLPSGPRPGTAWRASTPAEGHLLREGKRLDLMRRRLLTEIARMQIEHRTHRAELAALQSEITLLRRTSGDPARDSAALRAVERMTAKDLVILSAAARGETVKETAAALSVTAEAIQSRRQVAKRRLGARTFHEAVAMVVAANAARTGGDSR